MIITFHFFSWYIVCIGLSVPLPSKTPPSSFLPSPPSSPKSDNCPSPPFLGNRPSILVFRDPHLKAGFSVNPKNISFSSLNPSYLLEVTKFLVKISQFEFLVMTEKNNSVYKLFFVIKYFRLYFLCKNCNPPEKSHPLFPSNPTLKVEVFSSPPLLFLENLVGGSTFF